MAEGAGEPGDGERAPADGAALTAHVRRMEIEVAALIARGEAVPPEAERMLARLREVAEALAGLTASLTAGPATPPAPRRGGERDAREG